MKRIVSLVIALMLALGLCAFAEDAAQDAPVLLMTIDDENVYRDQVEDIAQLLYQYGYTDGINMELALRYVLLNQVAPFLLTATYRRTCWARKGTPSSRQSTQPSSMTTSSSTSRASPRRATPRKTRPPTSPRRRRTLRRRACTWTST
ncbi:MAG: hypothetical protein J6U72_04190 [Clostridia bacterium]|nr:hypothetical protein [Clostridia bacterium]